MGAEYSPAESTGTLACSGRMLGRHALTALLLLSLTWSLEAAGVTTEQAIRAATDATPVAFAPDPNALHSAYTSSLSCRPTLIEEPGSTEEVAAILKRLQADSKRTGRPFKVRATRREFHTTAAFVCAGSTYHHGPNPPAEPTSSAASTAQEPTAVNMLLHKLNGVLRVDGDKHQLTIGAGATLAQLLDAATAHNMTVPAGVLSVYANLTVGGVVLTSAHGTGAGVQSSLMDLLVDITWVDAHGGIQHSTADSAEGHAIPGSLGLLGVVTEVTLQLVPGLTVTRQQTKFLLDDAHLAADVQKLLEETPNTILLWRPDLGQYTAYQWLPVPEASGGSDEGAIKHDNAAAIFLSAVADDTAAAVKPLMAGWQADATDSSPAAAELHKGNCDVSKQFMRLSWVATPNGLSENATGLTNNMMVTRTECAPKCFWHSEHTGLTLWDMEFTLNMSRFAAWVEDIKALVKNEGPAAATAAAATAGVKDAAFERCMPAGHIWLRFGRGRPAQHRAGSSSNSGSSSGSLATNAGAEERVVYTQWSQLASTVATAQPMKYMHIVEAYEQLSMCKYGARPHWGKNLDRTFTHPTCHTRDLYPHAAFQGLLNLQAQHDPNHIFEPELFRKVTERSGPQLHSGCSLVGKCYCQEDAHCAQGYQCTSLQSLPQYKVCKPFAAMAADGDEIGAAQPALAGDDSSSTRDSTAGRHLEL